MKVITPIYRDEKATELNELLEQFLDNLRMESESLADVRMDLSLNNHERREKTFSELMENPIEFHELINIINEEAKLNEKIMIMEEIIYCAYEEHLVNDESPINNERRKYIKREDIPLALGENVKPYILKEDNPTQYGLSEETGIPSSTLSYWVHKAYGIDWKEYVDLVKKGIL